MSFYVTLPSNASMHIYPTNVVSNYTTTLLNPIKLDGEWVVALSKLIYRNSIESVICTFQVTDKAGVKSIPITIQENETLIDVFRKLDTDSKTLFTDLIVTKLVDKTLTLTPAKGVSFSLVGALPFILNIDSKLRYYPDKPLALVGNDSKIQKTDSIYLYADFIEDQIVGDTKAPLLETISVSDKQNESVTVDINHLNYVNIAKSENKHYKYYVKKWIRRVYSFH